MPDARSIFSLQPYKSLSSRTYCSHSVTDSTIVSHFSALKPIHLWRLTIQVASNDAHGHIIPPPPQFSDALFSHIFTDNYWIDFVYLYVMYCTWITYSHAPTYYTWLLSLILFINTRMLTQQVITLFCVDSRVHKYYFVQDINLYIFKIHREQ